MQPMLHVLNGKIQSPAPIWFMRQAGRYLPEYRKIRQKIGGFLDLCYHPDLATEVTLQPIRRFDLDAAIIFSDILVTPHALGRRLWFVEGEGPRLEPLVLKSEVAAMEKEIPNVTSFLQPVLKAISQVRAELPKSKSLIGFVGAPWTMACYMIDGKGGKDFPKTRKLAYQDPIFMDELLDILARAATEFLMAQIKAGADVVQIFDSWASLLDEQAFHRFVIKPTKQITNELQKRAINAPIIGFPRGSGLLARDYAKLSGVNGLSLDISHPLKFAQLRLQSLLPVQGNLDPYRLLGDIDQCFQASQKILDHFGQAPFIFNLGHGIDLQTDPDRVLHLVDYVRSHS